MKKIGHFIPLIGWFYFDSLTLLFWFDLFLEARAEILTKISLFFVQFEDNKRTFRNSKGHFEINWPLSLAIPAGSFLSSTLTSLINGHARLFFTRTKIHPTHWCWFSILPFYISICSWFLIFSSLKFRGCWTSFFA